MLQQWLYATLPICSFSLKTKIPSLSGKICIPKTLGEHIRKERTKRGVAQKDVADTLGINQMYLSSWELNQKSCLPKYVTAIIEFLGYVPKLKSKFDKLGTRLKLWRIDNNLSLFEISEMVEISITELEKIETARYCKVDKTTSRTLEQLICKRVTSFSSEVTA